MHVTSIEVGRNFDRSFVLNELVGFFDDFLFNFTANKKLQYERIKFPLRVVEGDNVTAIDRKEWQMEKFFTKHLGRAFADYPLFIAKYSNIQPNIGYRWIMWQFSDCGVFKPAVKGNAGEVDLSRFNKGCSINDILYHPSKHKPKSSVHDAVDRKEKPTSVNLAEQKAKEAPKPSKRQQEEAQRQADKEKKAKERSKKLAEEEAKKKAEEAKKAQEKAERLKKEKARQQAHEAALKKEAEEKAKRKAAAKKAREEKTREEKAKKSSSGKSNKSTSLLQTSSSKLSQSQRNDSIRASKNKGRKTNKSSADND